MIKGVRNVRVKSTDASLFEMVSEECSELSHVSLKLARYLRREQLVSETFDPDSAISNFEAGRYNPGLYFLYRYAKACNKTMHITFEDRKD